MTGKILERDDTYLRDKITRYEPSEAEEDLDALETAVRHYGMVGFAANQLGINNRVCVIKNGFSFIRLHDPYITMRSARKVLSKEGCFSLPNYWTKIQRYQNITVCHVVNGEKKYSNYDGKCGIIAQHEIDHLEGILISDYVDAGIAWRM